MDRATMEQLAEKAGVRFFGNWIEGSQEALYRFAELVLEHDEQEPQENAPHG